MRAHTGPAGQPFESPFLEGATGSGGVTIGGGDEPLTLDFNKMQRTKRYAQ